MARTLRIDTAASPSLRLERARRAASENGVTLVGNESAGRFSHRMLEGNYRRLGRTVIVTITHMHRLVPWSVLEGRLRGLFGGASPGMPPVREKSTARRTQGRRRASDRSVGETPHTLSTTNEEGVEIHALHKTSRSFIREPRRRGFLRTLALRRSKKVRGLEGMLRPDPETSKRLQPREE
jgi:hypothetical protein